MAQRNLLNLGPPGAGKGTQGQRLGLALGLPWISSGDLLRGADRDGTDVGHDAAPHMTRGTLVRVDVVVALVSQRVAGITLTRQRDTSISTPTPGRTPPSGALTIRAGPICTASCRSPASCGRCLQR
jgi:hypothetical protein